MIFRCDVILHLFFSSSVVKIPRAENMKLKSNVGVAIEVRFFIGRNKALVY